MLFSCPWVHRSFHAKGRRTLDAELPREAGFLHPLDLPRMRETLAAAQVDMSRMWRGFIGSKIRASRGNSASSVR